MKISDYIEWGLLGGILLCSVIMGIIVFVSNISIVIIVFSIIALILLAGHEIIRLLKSKGIIKW